MRSRDMERRRETWRGRCSEDTGIKSTRCEFGGGQRSKTSLRSRRESKGMMEREKERERVCVCVCVRACMKWGWQNGGGRVW